MNRRQFLQTAGVLAVTTAAGPPLHFDAAAFASVTAHRLPRWRGFNLTEKCVHRPEGNPPFQQSDFALMAEWGFDFARLPLSYLCWTDPNDWLKVRQEKLADLDDALELG